MNRSPVFEQTYRSYLEQLGGVDLLGRAEILGAAVDGKDLVIRYFGDEYRVSKGGITTGSGSEAAQTPRVVLARYVLACPESPPSSAGPLMSYREFPDAAPLVSYFANRVHTAITGAFSGAAGELARRGSRVGGEALDNDGYDVSLRFTALPRIPVDLYFNDGDDQFPAACSVLFRSSVSCYLDMECVAMIGSELARKLIGK